MPDWLPASLDDAETLYPKIVGWAADEYGEEGAWEARRTLARSDLYYLLRHICNRGDMHNPWVFDRCRMVQAAPNGFLDLWAREHYKSTIITFGMTMLDILNNPEITVGFFSHTATIARAFLRQIRLEFEFNETLRLLFPDILWDRPKPEAPKWGDAEGIIVKRRHNPKEGTIEAWGLTDGMPTSKHYFLRNYDDVVTIDSVSTPEQIKKTTEAWRMSINLGKRGGIARTTGTTYAFGDTYQTMIEQKSVVPRIFPATEDGTEGGKPVLMSFAELHEKRRDMGPYTFAAQMLLNPVADKAMNFRLDWLRYHEGVKRDQVNLLILVDPARTRKKTSDYTVMWVVGLAADGNWYIVDGIRDRLNLPERGRALMGLHRGWSENGKYQIRVGYEKTGHEGDIDYLAELMDRETYHFDVYPIEATSAMAGPDRIRRLVPIFERRGIFLPHSIVRLDYEGRSVDLVRQFREEEYLPFPVGAHDDMLMALSFICDPEMRIEPPKAAEAESNRLRALLRDRRRERGGSIMAG